MNKDDNFVAEVEKEVRKINKEKIKEYDSSVDENDFVDDLILKERGTFPETQLDETLPLAKQKLRENYHLIRDTLIKYLDLKEEHYSLISVWIIGTHFHSGFSSYPYLFLNAMRGSGKTRTLKLITTLSKEGNVMASPTEAVLFRTKGTLGIDEFEGIGNKDKSSIRELLNASYKKGTKIFRLKKKRTPEGELQVVEEFEPYRPIVMANISGMEEVLGDRCISLILEKSNCPVRTRLIEDFDNDDDVINIQKNFDRCRECSVELSKKLYKTWNDYVFTKDTYIHTHTTHTTHTNYNTPHISTPFHTLNTTQVLENLEITSFFNKIDSSGIYGRSLELFIPLFFISNIIDPHLLEEIINIARDIAKDKSDEEEVESRDVQVFDFVSKVGDSLTMMSVKRLTEEFKRFIGYEPEINDNWLNIQWFGKALKRLGLVIDKRRIASGVEVILNHAKARNKLKLWSKK